MGSISASLLQEGTLHGVNYFLYLTINYFIWVQLVLVSYKKVHYMGSISACLLKEGTFYGVN
jgi:hypothetical protein